MIDWLRRMFGRRERPSGREQRLVGRHLRLLRRAHQALPGDEVIDRLMREADDTVRHS